MEGKNQNRDTARRAYTEAEKEMREKQITAVKELVLLTLEKLESEKKSRDTATANIRILQKDLEDMKAGRLDRIEERQKKDIKAKAVSVAVIDRVIMKEEHHHDHYIIEPQRWYEPWNVVYCAGASATSSPSITLNNSVAADYTGGAYTLSSGIVMHV